jgi:GTPase SAR1 family protein
MGVCHSEVEYEPLLYSKPVRVLMLGEPGVGRKTLVQAFLSNAEVQEFRLEEEEPVNDGADDSVFFGDSLDYSLQPLDRPQTLDLLAECIDYDLDLQTEETRLDDLDLREDEDRTYDASALGLTPPHYLGAVTLSNSKQVQMEISTTAPLVGTNADKKIEGAINWAHVVVVVYSADNSASFQSAEKSLSETRRIAKSKNFQKFLLVLVENKMDVPKASKMEEGRGAGVARAHEAGFLETSATKAWNVRELFVSLAEAAYLHGPDFFNGLGKTVKAAKR